MLIHDYNKRKQYFGLHLFPKLLSLPSQSYPGWHHWQCYKICTSHSLLSSLRGDSRHHQTQSGFSLLTCNLRSSWIQFDSEEKPPLFFLKQKGFPFSSDAVQELLKSSHVLIKQSRQKKSVEHADPNLVFFFFLVNLSSCIDDKMAPRHACTGVKHVSVAAVGKHPA